MNTMQIFLGAMAVINIATIASLFYIYRDCLVDENN